MNADHKWAAVLGFEHALVIFIQSGKCSNAVLGFFFIW